jgi:alpha-1,2-mannosyltransferase
MVGSTRNEDDRALVQSLKDAATVLAINDNVVFVIDAPFTDLHGWLCCSQVGLHTMWNEHFGISVVEMMAAGLITVAHDSGGPKLDLISPVPIPLDESTRTASSADAIDAAYSTGYLATTASQYAQCIQLALDTYKDSLTLRQRARESSLRFSDEAFATSILQIFTRIVT